MERTMAVEAGAVNRPLPAKGAVRWFGDARSAALATVAATFIAAAVGYGIFFRLAKQYPSTSPASIMAVAAACIAMSWVRIDTLSPALRLFVRASAIVCGTNGFLLYPNFPIADDALGGWARILVLTVWGLTLPAAILALWRPAWLIFCSFYLIWIKLYAGYLTGFWYQTTLDILPIFQTPAIVGCTVAGLAIIGRARPKLGAVMAENRDLVCGATLLAGIATHAASYFRSGLYKLLIDGPLFYWPLSNEMKYFFRGALYQKLLLWADLPFVTQIMDALLDFVRLPMSIAIFVAQIGAVAAFANKRLMIVLFAFLDLMHFGIFVAAGANFWQWLVFNLVIIAAVARLPAGYFNWRAGLVCGAVVIASPLAVANATLAWIDTPAINAMYFTVRDDKGHETRVPFTYFGFYSYPLGHASFGLPPGLQVATRTGGSAYSAALAERLKTCDIQAESSASPFAGDWKPQAVAKFIRDYHHWMLRQHRDGHWRHMLYPHHFWNAPSIAPEFDRVDLTKVDAYVLHVEAVCVTGLGTARKLGSSEYVIDVR